MARFEVAKRSATGLFGQVVGLVVWQDVGCHFEERIRNVKSGTALVDFFLVSSTHVMNGSTGVASHRQVELAFMRQWVKINFRSGLVQIAAVFVSGDLTEVVLVEIAGETLVLAETVWIQKLLLHIGHIVIASVSFFFNLARMETVFVLDSA